MATFIPKNVAIFQMSSESKELDSILLSMVFFLFYGIVRKDFLQQNPKKLI
jgi:hypothetical protein